MRPVTCWDQICGFRKFIRPFAFLPVSLSLNIVFFCCLSSSVCEPRRWWWSAWGMVLHTAVTLSRNGPTTMLCHCFEVVKDNHKKYGTGSKAVRFIDMHRASYIWIQIAPHELFNGHCLNVSISTRICEAKQKKDVCSLYCKRIRSGRTKQMQMNCWGQSSMPPPRLTLTVMFCLS